MHYFRNGEHIGAIEINSNEDLIKLINKEVYGINESTERFAEIAKTIGDEYRSNYRNHDRTERLGEQNDRDDTVHSGQSSERGANQREVFADNAEREQIIAEAKANGTYMMHNGQPTNLTEDQWVTVRTQACCVYPSNCSLKS